MKFYLFFIFLAVYNAGCMTTLQLQHYAIYPAVGRENFAGYMRANNRAAALPTILPAMLLLLTSIAMLFYRPQFVRQAEAVGHLVHPDRLAVALGVRHPEVALDVLLGRRALLLAHDDDRPAVELGDAANDRGVVAEAAIAVQLLETIEYARDHVEGVWTLDVARRLHGIPRASARGEL